MSFERILDGKKNKSYEISTLRKIDDQYRNLLLENQTLNTRIDELTETIKTNEEKSDRRFGELYAYMMKLEKAYYNGLRVPRAQKNPLSEDTTPNSNSINIPNSNNTETMKELFLPN